jgi:hypothetical protein
LKLQVSIKMLFQQTFALESYIVIHGVPESSIRSRSFKLVEDEEVGEAGPFKLHLDQSLVEAPKKLRGSACGLQRYASLSHVKCSGASAVSVDRGEKCG